MEKFGNLVVNMEFRTRCKHCLSLYTFLSFAFTFCIHLIVLTFILLAWSQSYWCMLSYPCNACHDSIYLLQSCVNVVFKLVCGLPSLSSFDQDNNPFCSHVAFGWFISFAMRFIFFLVLWRPIDLGIDMVFWPWLNNSFWLWRSSAT